jgi:hypothetical protein
VSDRAKNNIPKAYQTSNRTSNKKRGEDGIDLICFMMRNGIKEGKRLTYDVPHPLRSKEKLNKEKVFVDRAAKRRL